MISFQYLSQLPVRLTTFLFPFLESLRRIFYARTASSQELAADIPGGTWGRILSNRSPRQNGYTTIDESTAEMELYLGWYYDALTRREVVSAVAHGEAALRLMGLLRSRVRGVRADKIEKRGVRIRLQLRALGHEPSMEGESETDTETDTE